MDNFTFFGPLKILQIEQSEKGITYWLNWSQATEILYVI